MLTLWGLSDIIKMSRGTRKPLFSTQIKTKERKNIMKNQKTNTQTLTYEHLFHRKPHESGEKAQKVTKSKKKTVKTQANNSKETENKRTFDIVKRDFETAYATGDYSVELLELSTAVAYSVVKKCKDPQRKAAPERETVSNSGCNPAMVQIWREIGADVHALDTLRDCVDRATAWGYNRDGDKVLEVVDKDAETAVDNLVSERLGDGIDLVQTAAAALLEQAATYSNMGPGWLDSPVTVRRLARRTYTRLDTPVDWRDHDTVPIVEVFAAVRRAVDQSRAVQTDPKNGYSYLEELSQDGESGALETIYRRLHKYADMGGQDSHGLQTADTQTAVDVETMMDSLELTARQRTIIWKRLQGMSLRAIAEDFGVDPKAVRKTMARVQKKAVELGYFKEK